MDVIIIVFVIVGKAINGGDDDGWTKIRPSDGTEEEGDCVVVLSGYLWWT